MEGPMESMRSRSLAAGFLVTLLLCDACVSPAAIRANRQWESEMLAAKRAHIAMRYEEAELHYREALEIAPRTARPHRTLYATCNNLALLHSDQRELVEAAELYAKEISAFEYGGEGDEELLLRTFEDYETVLRELHRVQEADAVRARARIIRD